MPVSPHPELQIVLDRQGAGRYTKTSYPIRYGRYHELRWGDYVAQCNLRCEIKYLAKSGADWPHPTEWLKRSEGGDWIYYSTGGYYSGVYDLLGEHYLPCLDYPSNSLFRENPFACEATRGALAASEEMTVQAGHAYAKAVEEELDGDVCRFLHRLARTGGNYFARKRERLGAILDAEISVLPPDSRHVDYEIVPLVLTDGCLYRCRFCSVKTGRDLSRRSKKDILRQLEQLAAYYSADLANCNSLFLGQHDSLAARDSDILFAAEAAYRILKFATSHLREPNLFLFGSVHAFLEKDEAFFEALAKLPYTSFINLGLESFDRLTLSNLGKPTGPELVKASFLKALQINRRFANIEVSVNVVLGDDLPDSHWRSLLDAFGRNDCYPRGRLTVYCSPLCGSSDNRGLLGRFRQLKRRSAYETWLYQIQRF